MLMNGKSCLIPLLESILQEFYLSNIEHDVMMSKIPFLSLLSRSACLKQFSENTFMSVRQIQEQTKVHFKSLQFLVGTFEIVC